MELAVIWYWRKTAKGGQHEMFYAWLFLLLIYEVKFQQPEG